MGLPYPVFPYAEAEFAAWPRPAIGVATGVVEARGLIQSNRDGLPESFGVVRICRDFCTVWPGVSLEDSDPGTDEAEAVRPAADRCPLPAGRPERSARVRRLGLAAG